MIWFVKFSSMKRLTALSIGFIAVLCHCTYFPHSRDESSQSSQEVVSLTSPTPEFSDMSVDESGSGPQVVIASVVNGESSVCLSEKPRFGRGTALVLFRRDDKFSLERTQIEFESLVQTELSLSYPVKFRGSKRALFLLSDDGNLSPRTVRTLYLIPWNASIPDDKLFFDGLRIGDRRSFNIGDVVYTIRVSTGPNLQAGPTAVLVLENREKNQMIWYGAIFEKESEVGELEWVGDLDGDEHLDLLFKYFELNGGGSVDVLLLSSHAMPGNLVGPAAFSFARDCH
jgi:hypothetical protein